MKHKFFFINNFICCCCSCSLFTNVFHFFRRKMSNLKLYYFDFNGSNNIDNDKKKNGFNPRL